MKKLIKFGNPKLSKDIMIFNMGSARNCPSKKLGLCKVADICYARKAEKQYKQVIPYREKQIDYWLSHSAHEIWQDIDQLLKSKRKLPKYFRFNESGDFYSQECVEKLRYIAYSLKYFYGIKTYGYTARKDLDFSFIKEYCSSYLNIRLSGCDTKVLRDKKKKHIGFKVCLGKCGKGSCVACMETDSKIAFPAH